jgi:predicted amidohydrolase
MRIALAQLNPTSGDIDSNTAKVIDAIAEASAGGADLLVTPEMAMDVSGFDLRMPEGAPTCPRRPLRAR